MQLLHRLVREKDRFCPKTRIFVRQNRFFRSPAYEHTFFRAYYTCILHRSGGTRHAATPPDPKLSRHGAFRFFRSRRHRSRHGNGLSRSSLPQSAHPVRHLYDHPYRRLHGMDRTGSTCRHHGDRGNALPYRTGAGWLHSGLRDRQPGSHRGRARSSGLRQSVVRPLPRSAVYPLSGCDSENRDLHRLSYPRCRRDLSRETDHRRGRTVGKVQGNARTGHTVLRRRDHTGQRGGRWHGGNQPPHHAVSRMHHRRTDRDPRFRAVRDLIGKGRAACDG